MKKEVARAREAGYKIVYIDEVVFSAATMQKKAWAPAHHNIEYLDKRSHMKSQALVAGITQEEGLVAWLIFRRSINQYDYMEFVTQLRENLKDQKVALFMDNLSVHKSKKCKALYQELNLLPIFNAPYAPEYNGIENYWSAVKKVYKADMLDKVTQDSWIDVAAVAETALLSVSQEVAKNCARKGEERIYEI